MNKDNFKKLIGKTPSDWESKVIEKSQQPWLVSYSSKIARNISAILNSHPNLNQTKLGELIGVERQYISRIMQGKENLSLQTIWKLSNSLNFELLHIPEYKYESKRTTGYKELKQMSDAEDLMNVALVISYNETEWVRPDNDSPIKYSALK